MNWWSRLFHREQLEDQLEKELRFHLDRHTEDLVARGEAPDAARRQARLALGGPEQVKEECREARGTRWLENAAQDTRYALRSFRKKPGFTAATAMILALGVGATTVMFAVVNTVLLRPLSFPAPDRLVTVHGHLDNFGEFWGFSYPDLEDVRRESRTLAVAGWTYGGGTISAPGGPEYVDGRQISGELFSVLGIVPLHGRAFQPGDDRQGAPPVSLISYGLWQRRFGGDLSAIGKMLVFEGKPYNVIGIIPPGFQLSGDAEVYTPLGQRTDPRMENRGARFIHAVARLRPGVTLKEAQSEAGVMARALAKQYPKTNDGVGMRVRPLQQELVGDVRGTLLLLLSAVGLVLLVACANVASLLLTRAMAREREFAMRAAVGAGWGRLARQVLTESALLGAFGGVLGIVVANASVRPFVALWPGSLPRAEEIHLDWRVYAFGMAVSLFSGLLFGLAPALRVTRHSLEPALRAGGRTMVGGSRSVHSAFVICEIALALVLLISAGMLGNTLLKLASRDPGLNVHGVLTAHFAISPASLATPSRIRTAWQDVLDRARRVPGVKFAALADIIPMREGENSLSYRTTAAPLPSNEEPYALASSVTPDYLKVMGIPLRAGRFLNEHDAEGSEPVVVVDENLAHHAFGERNAVGRHLWISAMGAIPVRIVGVVGHVRHWGLAGDDESRVRDQIYYPFAQVPAPLLRFFSSVTSIAVRTDVPPPSLVKPLQFALRGAAGDQALYETRTMEQLVSASLARQRFLLLLFGIFAGMALLLAATGIYGVLAYLTGQRAPEMGVRMALGATAGDLMSLILGQCLRMVLPGLAMGALGALAAGYILKRLVQGMQPAPFAAFGIMVPLLLSAAMAASLVPARRASRVDPVRALRQE